MSSNLDNAATAAETYKGTAQILQGILIALSAVVAVIGYYVKSKLDRKAHLKEVELNHKTKLLEDVVAPAQSMAYGGLWARVNFIQYVAYPGVFSPVHSNTTPSELWFFGAGDSGKHCSELVHNFSSPNGIQLWTFVGKAKEDEMRQDPTGALAQKYRSFMRRIVKKYYRPLSDLLSQRMNILPLPDKEQFKKDYPGAAKTVAVRKSFFIQCVVWTDEMESIIEEEWDKGNFQNLFPVTSPFPYKLCQYLAGMLTHLKDEITALTENAIENRSNDADNKVTTMNQGENDSAKAKSKEKKYVVAGAAVGSSIATVVHVAAGTD